jgi:adenylosuccinate lyase
MDGRYANKEIEAIWSLKNKASLWQKSELAMIEARVRLGLVSNITYSAIKKHLKKPTRLNRWAELEAESHHDLGSWVDERKELLPPELQLYFHDGMTSYDTEEPAFLKMIVESVGIVEQQLGSLLHNLLELSLSHRDTVMVGKTHGQAAKLQSFGKMCFTWWRNLRLGADELQRSGMKLHHSKMSGAIGTYGDVTPELEEGALNILGFDPFYGATQIMPREIYAPLAAALYQLVLTCEKIATDIRLGARSTLPLFHEPFDEKQKGSSAMPHKKNTIVTEKICGMARLAEGYFSAIMRNIVTWEERAIEQSSVERVAWPDLFHIIVHVIGQLSRVIKGLVVYPENMLEEALDLRGAHASDEAKGFLSKHLAAVGIDSRAVYRMVQLACFNVHAGRLVRKQDSEIYNGSDFDVKYKVDNLFRVCTKSDKWLLSICDILRDGQLQSSVSLKVSEEEITSWNKALLNLFDNDRLREEWEALFLPSYALRYERVLFQKVIGDNL